MKTINLRPKVSAKILKDCSDLYERDLSELSKSFFPGEWVYFQDACDQKMFIGYVNLSVANGAIGRVVGQVDTNTPDGEEESRVALNTIFEKLRLAFERRSFLAEGEKNCVRLVFGAADSLPGLLVDVYSNVVTIQVGTAGIDRFRNEIKDFFKKKYPEKEVSFLNALSGNSSEILPAHGDEGVPCDVELEENGFKYILTKNVVQKNGYYYDHRDNRKKLEQKLSQMNLNLSKGLDLFCYIGSWGMHLLRAGVKDVEFIDQGNMEDVVSKNLKRNGFEGRGSFAKKNVFNFLDEEVLKNSRYDVIVSDPPAFSKQKEKTKNALGGYSKLCGKIMKILADKSFFVMASCTHNVFFNDLDKIVIDQAVRNNMKVQMLDIGIQSSDHPFTSFESNNYYLKYLLYYVERKTEMEK